MSENKNEDASPIIKFKAQISKVTTMADGGLRLVLDLSESEIEVAKKMMEVRLAGAILELVAIPVIDNGWSNG